LYFLFYFKQHGYANRTSSHEGARESSSKVEESSQLCSAKRKIKKIAIVHRHFSWESENSDYRKICQSTRSDSRLCEFHRLRISTLANKSLLISPLKNLSDIWLGLAIALKMGFSKSIYSRSRKDIKKVIIENERGEKINKDPSFTFLKV
jgi:hypothetical protein